MEFSYNGMSYFIERNKNEPEIYYYKRCWLIAKNNPQNETEYKEIEKLSHLWINTNYLGCKYNEEVEKNIKKLINI